MMDLNGRKAGIYIRRSNPTQQESLEEQLKSIRASAKAMGIEIVESLIFCDSASGTKRQGRSGLEQMMAAVRSGDFAKHGATLLLFWVTDRFARNTTDALVVESELSRQGIQVFSATERYDITTAGGRTEFILRSCFAEIQNKLRAADLKRGQRRAVLGGKCIGMPIYGYRKNEVSQLCIDVPAAAIVRKIFRLFIAGWSPRQITAALNAAHVPSPAGGPWNSVTVRRTIRVETYIGILIHGMGQRKFKRDTAIVEPNHHPAIVDVSTYIRAQQIVGERASLKRYTSTIRHFYLLSGIGALRCGLCGSAILGKWYRNHQLEYTYYRCAKGLQRGQNCELPGIKCEVLDDLILKKLESFATDHGAISGAWAKYRKELAPAVFPLEEELKGLERQRQNLEMRHRRLLLLWEEKKSGGEALKRRIKEVEDQLEGLSLQRHSLREKLSRASGKPQDPEVIERLANFRESFARLGPVEKKMLIKLFVKSVVALGAREFRVELRFMPKEFILKADDGIGRAKP